MNQYGWLYDYVDGDTPDWSVRPNQIFTCAFDYSPLDLKQKKTVVDIVTKELLTPKGLRSLSPKSFGYNPNYVGPQRERDYAYHQGTAWPWLASFYFEAYLKVFKMSGLSFVERHVRIVVLMRDGVGEVVGVGLEHLRDAAAGVNRRNGHGIAGG